MDKFTKNALFVGGVALAGFIGYNLIKNAGNPKANGNNPPYTPSTPGITAEEDIKSKALANQIFDAMNGCGTNEDAIMSAFSEIRNAMMFQAVVNNYGSRTISSEWWCFGVKSFTGNLSESLRNELSQSYIDQINAMLAQNNISKQI